jgi:hypothetical protein
VDTQGYFGSAYPRAAFVTSPALTIFVSVALTVPVPIPVSAPSSEAVRGPALSAARIFALFSPRGARAAGEVGWAAG